MPRAKKSESYDAKPKRGRSSGRKQSPTYSIERYGAGFLIARYTGNSGAYCGVSMDWSSQPIVEDPFLTKEAAEAAIPGAETETAKRGKSREYEVATVVLSRCNVCQSTDRSDYEKPAEVEAVGEHDGKPFNVIVLRHCMCTACGQWRIDRFHELRAKSRNPSK